MASSAGDNDLERPRMFQKLTFLAVRTVTGSLTCLLVSTSGDASGGSWHCPFSRRACVASDKLSEGRVERSLVRLVLWAVMSEVV